MITPKLPSTETHMTVLSAMTSFHSSAQTMSSWDNEVFGVQIPSELAVSSSVCSLSGRHQRMRGFLTGLAFQARRKESGP